MEIESVRSATAEFLENCSLEHSVNIVIEKNRKDFYEKRIWESTGIKKELEVLDAPGEFLPTKGIIALYADHIQDKKDLHETIRHELFGHYGLNTFSLVEKGAFLEEIYKTRQSKDEKIKELWEKVDFDYAGASPSIKAEEFFCLIAEDPEAFQSSGFEKVRNLFTKLLSKVGLVQEYLTIDEMREEALHLAEGIRSGERKMQMTGGYGDGFEVLDGQGKSLYGPALDQSKEKAKKQKLG